MAKCVTCQSEVPDDQVHCIEFKYGFDLVAFSKVHSCSVECTRKHAHSGKVKWVNWIEYCRDAYRKMESLTDYRRAFPANALMKDIINAAHGIV